MSMKQIENSITQLVQRIKSTNEFSECTFVKGHKSSECANPLLNYMVAVSVCDIESSVRFIGESVGENLNGSIVNVGVKFRIYSPKKSGGDALLEMAVKLSSAIKSCDEQNLCQGIEVSGIAFDSDMLTVYRDVVAKLSFCLYEEVAI